MDAFPVADAGEEHVNDSTTSESDQFGIQTKEMVIPASVLPWRVRHCSRASMQSHCRHVEVQPVKSFCRIFIRGK